MNELITDNSKSTPGTQIVLIVGNSRSGTTMMGRAFGNHPSVFTFNELHFFEELWNPQAEPKPLDPQQAVSFMARLLTIQRDGYFYQKDIQSYVPEAKDVLTHVSGELTPPVLFQTFLAYETQCHGKSIACLQTPRNVYYLTEILALYSGAYAVNMIRDPRAILLSQKRRWVGRLSGSRKIPLKQIIRTWTDYHPITISLMWRSGILAGDQFMQHQRVLPVRFEDLLSKQEETFRDICTFLRLDFHAEMLEVPHVGSSNRPDQFDHMGIDSSVAERWRQGGLRKEEVYIIQELTKQKMIRHGYAVEKIKPNPLLLFFYAISWAPKMSFALLLNIRRAHNLIPAIRKRLMN